MASIERQLYAYASPQAGRPLELSLIESGVAPHSALFGGVDFGRPRDSCRTSISAASDNLLWQFVVAADGLSTGVRAQSNRDCLNDKNRPLQHPAEPLCLTLAPPVLGSRGASCAVFLEFDCCSATPRRQLIDMLMQGSAFLMFSVQTCNYNPWTSST